MRYKLKDYQQVMIDNIMIAFKKKSQRPLFFIPFKSNGVALFHQEYGRTKRSKNKSIVVDHTMKTLPLLLILFSMSYCQELFHQRLKPWEKLGLTSTEYKLARDSSLSDETIKKLISTGIEIDVYLSKPWEKYHIKECQWFALVRSGLSDEDIELLTRHRKYRIRCRR